MAKCLYRENLLRNENENFRTRINYCLLGAKVPGSEISRNLKLKRLSSIEFSEADLLRFIFNIRINNFNSH